MLCAFAPTSYRPFTFHAVHPVTHILDGKKQAYSFERRTILYIGVSKSFLSFSVEREHST